MGLNIVVLAPDGIVWETPAEEVVLPSKTGQLGILPNHAPLITALDIGVLRVKIDQAWKLLVTFGGVAHVVDNKVSVLISGSEEVLKEDYEESLQFMKEAAESLRNAQTLTLKQKIEAAQMYKLALTKIQAYEFLNRN